MFNYTKMNPKMTTKTTTKMTTTNIVESHTREGNADRTSGKQTVTLGHIT